MRKLTFVLTAHFLVVAACAATDTPAFKWTNTSDPAADLGRAKQTCTDRAAAATASLYNENAATKAALDVFLKCMREQGWTQVQQDQHE